MSTNTVENILQDNGAFKGAHGLEGLLYADEFWEDQSYGTRLYYGEGITDYLHRDVLRCAVEVIKMNPAAPEMLKELQADEDATQLSPQEFFMKYGYNVSERGERRRAVIAKAKGE